MTFLAGLILIAAAVLEVGGDAVIRLGLRGGSPAVIVAGGLALGCYGLVVNLVKWDFSRLLGVYVAVFAVVSVLTGRFLFKEERAGFDLVGPGGHRCRRAGDSTRKVSWQIMSSYK